MEAFFNNEVFAALPLGDNHYLLVGLALGMCRHRHRGSCGESGGRAVLTPPMGRLVRSSH